MREVVAVRTGGVMAQHEGSEDWDGRGAWARPSVRLRV